MGIFFIQNALIPSKFLFLLPIDHSSQEPILIISTMTPWLCSVILILCCHLKLSYFQEIYVLICIKRPLLSSNRTQGFIGNV